MSATVESFLVDPDCEFFAPASTDMIDTLVGQYQQARQRIEQVAEFAASETFGSVIDYFLEGNSTDERGQSSLRASASQLFQPAGAVAQLNAAYWSKALSLTDVYDAMPQDRRNQWNAQIRCPKGVRKHRSETEWETPPLPEFEEKTVRATLQALLASRAKFFAERVDGIFRALSGEHVTNSPSAFGKRMIIAGLVTYYGSTDSDRVGYINDLRCVIARFMGRTDEPGWRSTTAIVERARKERRGEWISIDGGALRLRAYLCGTAHLEVHPDMAWRLNSILAHLYPLAIPPEFRQKPKRKPKGVELMMRPLPFAVLALLADMKPAVEFIPQPDNWREKYRLQQIKNAVSFDRVGTDKHVIAEAERVLESIGGVRATTGKAINYWQFDYDPRDVIADIVASGCVPDDKSHQFYPTPDELADMAVDLAEIGPDHSCAEPSAGTGAIADRMPKDRTMCMEVSKLRADVLAAKGYTVINADFLALSEHEFKFDRIVMNPPFDRGQWQAHLQHAAAMLNRGGRLVAILPASAKGKDVLPAGFRVEWHQTFENEFAGTGVSVVFMIAERSK